MYSKMPTEFLFQALDAQLLHILRSIFCDCTHLRLIAHGGNILR